MYVILFIWLWHELIYKIMSPSPPISKGKVFTVGRSLTTCTITEENNECSKFVFDKMISASLAWMAVTSHSIF